MSGNKNERVERIQEALKEANLDAVICSLPTNVLLLSGYWPVVGTAIAIATREGTIVVIAPEDEYELARKGWADVVRTFQPSSLDSIANSTSTISIEIADIAGRLLIKARVGFESGPMFAPSSYAAAHFYGAHIIDLLNTSMPSASLLPADELLARLKSIKTDYEVSRIRQACDIAELAFREGASELRVGLREIEAAEKFRAPLSVKGIGYEGAERADGFVFCMSGSNSAEAYRAYARSRARHIAAGDLVLIHCNSYVDGYWTDITRTYAFDDSVAPKRRMYEAVAAAREAALSVIKPGVKAAQVDRSARHVLETFGFGKQFKHSTGHGVGFGAIDHNARPRLHPKSDDVLQPGMIFNVEPAVYVDGFGGLRHCDVVAVTPTGAEVLTNFQLSLERIQDHDHTLCFEH